MKTCPVFLLLFLLGCKGQRFYWETRFSVSDQTPVLKERVIEKFKLTGKMSDWHPVFGEYCMALPSYQAHLFVCWKNHLIKVASSYEGSIKGDETVSKNPSTVRKYLNHISDQPGYAEHEAIIHFIQKHYRIRSREDRLLDYGPGSVMLKEELSGENTPTP